MKVMAIHNAGKADVYNMEVEGTHDFAIANGIIVHNCYDEFRYACMENPINPPAADPKKPNQYGEDPLELNKKVEYDKYNFMKL